MQRAEIEVLAAAAGHPCVSIFLPMHRGGIQVRQDRPRLKNLIADAETRLTELGASRQDAERLLAPARALLTDGDEIWQHPGDGLAVFVSPQLCRWYRVHLELPERLVVGERFHVKPLLHLLDDERRFYVLAFSQNAVRFFTANREEISEFDVAGLPRSLCDVVGTDRKQASLQFHSAGGHAAAGDRPGRSIVHGHGSVGDDEIRKREAAHFVEAVERSLAPVLARQPAPLVVAAVEEIVAIWREKTRSPALFAGAITGNADRESAERLRERAWPIVEPVFSKAREQAAAKFRELKATGRATSELEGVLLAAADGRVDTLFVRDDECRWGRFDLGSRHVDVHDSEQPGDEDLLDRAAIDTLLARGTVYTLAPSQMPADAALCASFRY